MEVGRFLQAALLTLDAGLQVSVVPSAEEALLEASRQKIDLLVSDVRLPGMSGVELVYKIRKRYETMKVIVITGYPDEKLEQEARSMGLEGFFRKPMPVPDFLNTVSQALEIERKPGESGGSRQPVETGSLAEKLAALRQSLGAMGTALLDERGRVAAQAGDFPFEDLETTWSPPLLAALGSAADVKRLFIQGGVQNVQAYRGKNFDLVLAPVGNHALLIATPAGGSSLRLALAVEEAMKAQQDLLAVLEGMGLHAEPGLGAAEKRPDAMMLPEVEEPAEPEVDLEAFSKALEKTTDEIQHQDANVYWDSLAGMTKAETGNPDVLSYDQAVQLGLAPEEKKEE